MKHAIIILCHNNTEVVKTAMRLLDDERFTFYLQIDKKSHISHEQFIPTLENSICEIVKPINMNWGGWSYCEGVLQSIEYAVNNNDYIHVLQGADLPLKTPEEIDAFFERRRPDNYFDFGCFSECEELDYRIKCKHFFLDNRFYRESKILHGANYCCAKIQQKISQNHQMKNYYMSSALFSVTKEFAEYLVERKSQLKSEFRFSYGGDEVCFGTEFMNSPFADTLSDKGNCRLVDWDRRVKSSPHTFTVEDKKLIEQAIKDPDIIFARKFSESIDIDIVRHIENELKR